MNTASSFGERLAGSSCSLPTLPLDDVLRLHADAGFVKLEGFTSWATSALSLDVRPGAYAEQAQQLGVRFSSLHLPVVGDDLEVGVMAAVNATRWAAALGVSVVLFKANSVANYVAAAGTFLDGIAELPVTAVIQNHWGTAICTLDDYARVLDGIGDSRMKTVLEVGHFCKAGVHWQDACALMEERIALVHLKDMRGGQAVPFGTGDVDFSALFDHLANIGYTGDFVVELEVTADVAKTIELIGAARAQLIQSWRQSQDA